VRAISTTLSVPNFKASKMTDTHSRLCKVGLILPEAEFDMGGQTAGWRDYVTMAGVAEDIGVDSLWFVDHLLYPASPR
jgi:hypothetical protein